MVSVAVTVTLRAADADPLGVAQVVMERHAQLLVGDAKRNLGENGSHATGKLGQSLQGGVDRQGDVLSLWIGMQSYGRYVELGRRPGTPPPTSAIIEWMKRKPVALPPGQADINFAFGVQRQIAAKRGGAGPPIAALLEWMDDNGIHPTKAEALRAYARGIALSIGKHGIDPKPFLAPALAKRWPEFISELSERLEARP